MSRWLAIEHALAWLLAALALVALNLLGLVTPFVIIGLALLLWFAALFRGRLPETYAEWPARALLAAFLALGVLFAIRLWRNFARKRASEV